MIYNGEFRSTDTTIDPKGQLYKVVINTGISGKGAYHWVSDIFHPNALHPQNPVSIQLADDPFVVEYEGDTNIYKPYKCSIATARIMLPQLDKNLVCVKKNDMMVMLLKWKNSVHQVIDLQLGPVMIDDDKPEPNNKLTQQSVHDGGQVIWTGFDPSLYDDFCYDVEWIGYATPNVYSQSYTNILEPFELECQDALSTLQYFDYKVDQEIARSFWDTLVQCISQIDGVYKHVYLTKSIVVKPNDLRHALEKFTCLDGNWFDEDGKPTDCLSVIEQMMQYLNCTILQYKDNLYVVNYDAIASEQRIYKQFIRQPEGIAYEPGVVSWNKGGSIYLGSRLNINGLELSDSATQLSYTSTYKKVEVKTDEYYQDSIIPDINDDDQMEVTKRVLPTGPEEVTVGYFDNATLISENTKFNGLGKLPVYDRRTRAVKYAGKMLQPKTGLNNGTIELLNYKKDSKQSEGIAQFNETPLPELIKEFQETYVIAGCSILEYGGYLLPEGAQDSTILKQIFQGYNGARAFYFHTPSLLERELHDPNNWPPFDPEHPGQGGHDLYDIHRYPIKEVYNSALRKLQPRMNQPMLKITTKPLFLRAYRNQNDKKSGQFIAIKGDWTFYNTEIITHPVNTGWNTEVNPNLLAQANYMYEWVKIYVTDAKGNKKYVTSIEPTDGASYSYEWTNEECWCKLFYGGQGYDKVSYKKNRKGLVTTYTLCAESDAFENKFSIIKNNFGFNGTVIPVPSMDGDFYGKVTIEFNRPTGCGAELKDNRNPQTYVDYYARCSVLEGFDLKVIDYLETEYYGEEGSLDTNSEFVTEMVDYATEEFPTINNELSSGLNKSTNLAGVYINYIDNGTYHSSRVQNVSNTGNGIAALPEKIITNAIAETYREPKMMIDISLHSSDVDNHAIDTYVWNTQFPEKQFVADSFVINYGLNKARFRLFEKPSLLSKDISFSNITRNRRRNGDNLFNPIPRRAHEVLTDEVQPILSKYMNIKRGDNDTELNNRRDLFIIDDTIAPAEEPVQTTAIPTDPKTPSFIMKPLDPSLVPFVPSNQAELEKLYPDLIINPNRTKEDFKLPSKVLYPMTKDITIPTAGLIKKANVEVNFDSGYAQLSHPNNMNITSSTNNKGELLINY